MYARRIPSWDEYFLDMVNSVKSRSCDRSVQVGCVIVGNGNSVLSMGYNGFPRGVRDIEERHDRPLKYKITEHAERNAIYNAARNGVCLLGSVIYQKIWPCTDCCRGIIQSGISKVIIDGRGYSEDMAIWSDRWGDDFTISLEMFNEVNISTLVWKPGDTFIVANGENWRSIL